MFPMMLKRNKFRILALALTTFFSFWFSGTSVSQESKIWNQSGAVNQIQSGVNIHFSTGHEKDLDMIAAAGFKYIRMDFIWQETETERGKYNWADYDELTGNLKKRGLSAIYILDYSNSLYEDSVISKDPITGEESKDVASPGHPESIAAYARWAAAAAEHFRGSNILWEIWNEPNISFWKPAPDVNQYISMAKSACKAIKAAVPGSVIIAPGTSQVPLPFLEAFLASDISELIDGVSVHPYRDYSKPPETAESDYNKVREMIDKHSFNKKEKIPIISSEWGYASATKGVSTETQAAYLVRMQLANLLYGIPISIWYDWKNDGNDPANFEHNCGTVTSDLKPKPAYIAARTMNEQLKGHTLIRRIEVPDKNDFMLLFGNGSGSFILSAWTAGQPHSVEPGEIVPGSIYSGATDWKGDKTDVKSDNGRLIPVLTDKPLYISIVSRSK